MRVDPLYTLLIIGGLIFAGVSFLSPAPPSERQIVVDRSTILEFIQFRVRSFDAEAAGAILDNMSDDERTALINDFLNEEILYREAKQLNMDQTDYVIRRRMAQKLEFMNDTLADVPEPTDADLVTYYNNYKADFSEPARMSFVHVYKAEDAPSLDLVAQGLTPQNISQFSDLFAYQLSYAERPYDLILGHFGNEFADQIFDSDLPLKKWVGPIKSAQGFHLVYVTDRQDVSMPSFETVKDRVRAAWVRQEKVKVRDDIMARLRATYDIEITVQNR